jgi:hypothetical protein
MQEGYQPGSDTVRHCPRIQILPVRNDGNERNFTVTKSQHARLCIFQSGSIPSGVFKTIHEPPGIEAGPYFSGSVIGLGSEMTLERCLCIQSPGKEQDGVGLFCHVILE